MPEEKRMVFAQRLLILEDDFLGWRLLLDYSIDASIFSEVGQSIKLL